MRSFLIALVLMVCLALVPRPSLAATAAYDIVVHDGGGKLVVNAVLAETSPTVLSVQDGAEPFVRDVQILRPARRVGRKSYPAHWVALTRGVDCWPLPRWAMHGCRFRYVYQVGEACRQLHDLATASVHGPVYHIGPEVFLLRAWNPTHGTLRFAVHTHGDTHFVTGVTAIRTGVYEVLASDMEFGPDAAFGPLTVQSVAVPGARYRLAYLSNALPLKDEALIRWVSRTSLQVARYFQHFPAQKGLVLVLPSWDEFSSAHARGGSGWSVCLSVGGSMSAEELSRDTTLTHELVHVCTPGMHSAQHWMEEGIAVYLQHIIPAQNGTLSSADVWQDLMQDLPLGQPCRGDVGLNGSSVDDRTYYGGAMFWLMADLEIRQLSDGERTLRDALLAFNEAGGNITTLWHVQTLLHVGDRAVGAPVFHRLYARMALKPYKANLPRLWNRLGVVRDGQSVRFRSSAPLAHLRRSLTSNVHGRKALRSMSVTRRSQPTWFARSSDLTELP